MPAILLAGGGTLGPVTPLIAVARRLRETRDDLSFVWAGTDSGPEREIIEAEGIEFYTIPEAKLPRYLSKKLLTLPFDLLRAKKMAGYLLDAFHPRVVLSAGGFTAVPVVQEASKRRIPCMTHQLDARPLLSNRIMAPHCRYVTTSFAYDQKPFSTKGTIYHIPTPVRFSAADAPTRESACAFFNLDPAKPVMLAMGGGTGAIRLNQAIAAIEPRLPSNLQMIHVTGKGKMLHIETERSGYIAAEFLSEELPVALAACDIVVSRAGFGSLTELATFSKPVIAVPLPNSPQEDNVGRLRGCVIPVDQTEKDFEHRLLAFIIRLSEDERLRKKLGHALHQALPTDNGETLAHLVLSLLV